MKGATVTALSSTLTLDEIARATHGRVAAGGPAATVAGVSIDSRTIAKGQLFVAVKGPNFDGHDFVAAAASRGRGGGHGPSRRGGRRGPCPWCASARPRRP